MVAFCRSHGINLHLFISPGHVHFQAIIAEVGLWPQDQEWKHQLVAIVSDDAAQHPGAAPYVLWDFSQFSEVTAEPVPEEQGGAEMKNWWDLVHYKQAVGDWILDRLFNVNDPGHPVPADFGVRLDPATIDVALANDRAAQVNWQATHAAELHRKLATAAITSDKRVP